jgi:transcriptional regulator with XRE-family HTH domain
MREKQKLKRILGVSGWTHDKLADLMGVNNSTFSSWVRGESKAREAHVEKINWIYGELVEPLVCEIERRSDLVEKRLLEERVRGVAEDNVCKISVRAE